MAERQRRPAPPGILVLPSSRAASRELGPLAWLVLEEFALEAGTEGTLAIETSVRALSAEFGVGKEAAATALGRLVDLGFVRCQTRRRAGRYAGSSYILDADACCRAGLVITMDATVDSPCPETPCPVRRDTAKVAAATAADSASRSTPAGQRDAAAQSLFDFFDQQPTSATPEPLTPTAPVPSTTPAPPTSQPDHHSSPLLPLTPSSQPDALAPGVRRGVVNVAGNRAGELSALNGNLNGEPETLC